MIDPMEPPIDPTEQPPEDPCPDCGLCGDHYADCPSADPASVPEQRPVSGHAYADLRRDRLAADIHRAIENALIARMDAELELPRQALEKVTSILDRQTENMRQMMHSIGKSDARVRINIGAIEELRLAIEALRQEIKNR